jgi:hypothetical protein
MAVVDGSWWVGKLASGREYFSEGMVEDRES